jgi:hypothetical protein
MSLDAKLGNSEQHLANLEKFKSAAADDGGAVDEFKKVAEDLVDAMTTDNINLDNIEPIIEMLKFLKTP